MKILEWKSWIIEMKNSQDGLKRRTEDDGRESGLEVRSIGEEIEKNTSEEIVAKCPQI